METQKRTGHQPRTLSQNSALHLYCQQVADECVEVGATLRLVMNAVEQEGVYPNEKNIKSFFHIIGKAKYGKSHTSDLTKSELQDIYTTLRQALIKVNVLTEFPSQETLSTNEFYEKQIR